MAFVYTDLNKDFANTVGDLAIQLHDQDVVRQSMEMLLSVVQGEMLFLPEYGASLETHLQEPNDRETADAIRVQWLTGIERWEPRFRVNRRQTKIEADESDFSMKVRLAGSVPGLAQEAFAFNGSIQRGEQGVSL
jgi:phage baseplate assembly protein W